MSLTLAEVAKQLDVQPGKPIREAVRDGTLELHYLGNDEVSPELADQVMIIAPPFPDTRSGWSVRAKLGKMDRIDPVVIDTFVQESE